MCRRPEGDPVHSGPTNRGATAACLIRRASLDYEYTIFALTAKDVARCASRATRITKEGSGDVPIVKLKDRGQMTLPAEIRRALDLESGALLEARLEDGRVVLVPQTITSREKAFEEIKQVALRARARWQADGESEEDIERLIERAIREVRNEREEKQTP